MARVGRFYDAMQHRGQFPLPRVIIAHTRKRPIEVDRTEKRMPAKDAKPASLVVLYKFQKRPADFLPAPWGPNHPGMLVLDLISHVTHSVHSRPIYRFSIDRFR
jgi:hypothetical protein